jgi:hypothetical protein
LLSLLIASQGIEGLPEGVFGDRGYIFVGQAVIHPTAMFAPVDETRLL